MRVGLHGRNLLERAAVAANLVPRPFAESMFAMLLARTLMAGCKLGFFEALAEGPLGVEALAARTGTEPFGARKLLDALVACRYLRHDEGRYRLTAIARKWLVPASPASLHDSMLMRFLEWELLSGYEDFVRSGRRAEIHARLDDEQWGLYQRGMRSIAAPAAAELARRLALPRRATAMLDIGGSHGLHAVRLCQRHPALRATILDLPEAVRHAAPILAREGLGDRIVHRAGDALRDDLGERAFDLVLASSLVHHFDDPTNRALARRVARALRPGGLFAVLEPLRPSEPSGAGQGAALLDLYFAMTSGSGTWSLEEIQSWQEDAGLAVLRPLRLRRLPGVAVVSARKPG